MPVAIVMAFLSLSFQDNLTSQDKKEMNNENYRLCDCPFY